VRRQRGVKKMTSKELKEAFVRGEKVEYDGIIYNEIKSIVYWKKKNRIYESAVLEDSFGRSVVQVLGKDVKAVKTIN